MAKKRAEKLEVAQMEPAKVERSGKPVRLDLSPVDFERLEVCAKRRGLTKASYARMAVLDLVRADEAEAKGAR
jgi:hypothetical protein